MLDVAPGLPRESDTHRDARELLRANGHTPLDILRVNPDSILYRDRARRVMTAWIYLVATVPRVFVEPGMPAWPTVPLPPDQPATVDADGPPEYDGA